MLKQILIAQLVLIIFGMSCSQKSQPYQVLPFYQEFQSEILIETADTKIKRVNALCRDKAGELWAATEAGIWKYQQDTWINESFFTNKPVEGIHCDRYGRLWALMNNEIFYKSDATWKKAPIKLVKAHKQIEKSFIGHEQQLWVGTPEGIFISTLENRCDLLGTFLTFLPNQAIHTTQNGDVWVGLPKGVVCFGHYGMRTLYTGANGLPYEDIRCIASDGEILWFGTSRGAIKLTGDGKWEYYSSQRWLPDDHVNDIAIGTDGSVWIATNNGISKIARQRMTLAEKVDIYEETIRKRHDRHGLISRSRLMRAGDLSSSMMTDDDNDGLWTSIYVGAECFRYAVTGSEAARRNAIHSFEALERLETINGRAGFVSRSFIEVEKFRNAGGEWHLSEDGKWMWKGDTSSDELVGHYFAYALFHDLVAGGEHKQRVKALVARITDHILDHNYCMVDIDGLATRWAVWCPDSLNTPNWFLEHGLNALQILAFLRTAYHITGNERYLTEYHKLADIHSYAKNMINQKIMYPHEINHSDDELAFLPYYILFRYASEPEYLKYYRKSMARSWKYEAPEKCPLWNFIASFALKQALGIEDAVETLKQYPIDLVDWTVQNSHRADIRMDPKSDRFGHPQNLFVLAADERPIMKWNGNPYQLDGGSGGYSEDDGAAFLLPYWMGRYHGLISE